MKEWGKWGGISDAQAIAQQRYDKAHTKGLYLKLNTRTDQDILKWLQGQRSKQGAIKALIRERIAAENAGAAKNPKATNKE